MEKKDPKSFAITTERKNLEKLASDFDYYGACFIAANYCGLRNPLYTRRRAVWQHGWIPELYNVHPYIVGYAIDCENKENHYLVARKDQSNFLQSHGYRNAHAIGMPVIYTKSLDVKRKANSLLVMPIHSLSSTTHEHWNFDNYAKTIDGLREYFDEIVICIHPSCIKKNYWVKEFEALNFQIIEGVDIYDKNALYRLQEIMKHFEYVTTNGFGSHIAYAAYFGAKISIYGNFAEFKKEDFATEPFYAKYPEILEDSIHLATEQVTRSCLNELFVFPKDAVERTAWGKYQLGEDNKLSPREMRELLGWDIVSLIKNNTYKICRDLYRSSKKIYRKI